MNNPQSTSPERILDNFYSVYGWPGETPPRIIDPSGTTILSSEKESVINEEVTLLASLLNNQDLIDLSHDCRSLVWEIANLGSDVQLLEEIEQNLNILDFDVSRLLLGLHLYAQAGGTNPISKSDWNPIHKQSIAEGAMSKSYAKTMEIVGSTILRIYVAMVYLRGDIMTSSLSKINVDKAPKLVLIKKLFSHELIRHIRNAVAHGHISTSLGGLHLVDRSFEIVLTPGMADNICIWMFLFYYQSIMVISKGAG